MASIRFLSLTLLCALAGPPIAAQDTKPAAAPSNARKDPAAAEEILKKSIEANGTSKDMTCDLEMSMNIMGMSMKGLGKIATSADGKSRTEFSMDLPMGQGSTKTLVVLDGTNFWLVQDLPAPMGKHTIKSTPGEMDGMAKKGMGGMGGGGSAKQDPSSQISQFKQMFQFDTVEEVDLDGKPHWAISGAVTKDSLDKLTKDNPAAAMMSGMMKRGRLLIAKSDSRLTSSEMLTADGQKVIVMSYKNVNLQPKFAADTFVYTPKPDEKVETMDQFMKSMGAMMGGAGADEDEEEEDEEPAKPASKPAQRP